MNNTVTVLNVAIPVHLTCAGDLVPSIAFAVDSSSDDDEEEVNS